MIVIRGGEVLTSHGWDKVDLAVDKGRVVALDSNVHWSIDIDATGCLVGPGFVDMHTHLREPGQTWKEDIASASTAAIAGGYTAITAMPNTDPPMDNPDVVADVLASASRVGLVEVVPSAALTAGRAGKTPSDLEALHRIGVRLFTDDGDSVADRALLESVMSRLAGLNGAFVAQHAEDAHRTAGGHMHEGTLSRRLGIGGLPAAAESDVVARDLEIVAETGCHYHCQHVSAKMTVELIRTAKESGLPVTAEVTPHHLTFDDTSLAGLDTDFKMYPPLRSQADRRALLDALADGTIDVVATDHAPHLPAEKAVDFISAPRGVIGLETAAAATWEALGEKDRFFEVMATKPANIVGIENHGMPIEPGSPANIVIFDPKARWTAGEFSSKSSNSPYRDREMMGQVKATIRDGRLIYEAAVSVA